jgi:antitoxin (DNA-binding transcriptional repressor) of toxin-antitoxin stability system
MADTFEVFSVRDLRNKSSRLMKDAEGGRLSIITKHGRPVVLAAPFSGRTLTLGVAKDMALQLFQTGTISLAKAARLAGIPVADFMGLLAELDIPAVDYPVEELADERYL